MISFSCVARYLVQGTTGNTATHNSGPFVSGIPRTVATFSIRRPGGLIEYEAGPTTCHGLVFGTYWCISPKICVRSDRLCVLRVRTL
jgi:hypothetical protein